MKLENIPWLAIPGFALLVSLLMFTTGLSNFFTILLPTYLTEALFLIALGSAVAGYKKLLGGHTSNEVDRLTSLMALMWLLNQVFAHWFVIAQPMLVSWLTALVNLLAFAELVGNPIYPIEEMLEPVEPVLNIFSDQMDMLLLVVFSVMKIWLNTQQ
jgi:hypothetical protein